MAATRVVWLAEADRSGLAAESGAHLQGTGTWMGGQLARVGLVDHVGDGDRGLNDIA